MRIWYAFAIVLTLGCTDTLEIRSDLSGQWAAPPSVVGSGFDFTLTQIADSLHGSGAFRSKPGAPGRSQFSALMIVLALNSFSPTNQALAGSLRDVLT